MRLEAVKQDFVEVNPENKDLFIDDMAYCFRLFYFEIFAHEKEKLETALWKYVGVLESYIYNPDIFVYFVPPNKAFFIIEKVEDPLFKYEGIKYVGKHIWINPHYRKTKLYKKIWDFVHENFKGKMLLPAWIHTEHAYLLSKRLKPVMIVFEKE